MRVAIIENNVKQKIVLTRSILKINVTKHGAKAHKSREEIEKCYKRIL